MPRETAAEEFGAVMASLLIITIALVVSLGILFGAFLAISFTIRREDRARTLSWDAPDRTAQSVRALTGYTRRG
jgi:hypothetical protein